MNTTDRDYNLISPSAKWVLMMKGHTSIPFARETAELIVSPDKFHLDFENKDLIYWIRTMHFEWRYKSIDVLLSEAPIKNILELSSGYSFRGLDLTQKEDVYYIDTDLPEMIERKKEFMQQLPQSLNSKGKLELLPLNVVDEKQFEEVVEEFPPGPIAIVNEGLLIYLDTVEKEKLCRNIYKALKKRGGYWITADIYLKLKPRGIELNVGKKMDQFFEDMRVEENRFDSFEQAQEFFERMGFTIDKEAELDYSTLSIFPQVINNLPAEQRNNKDAMPKIHTTWRLRLAD